MSLALLLLFQINLSDFLLGLCKYKYQGPIHVSYFKVSALVIIVNAATDTQCIDCLSHCDRLKKTKIELHYNSLIELRLVQLSLSRVILVCPDRTLNFIWPVLSDR